MHHGGVLLDDHQLVDRDARVVAHAPQIVAGEVHEHDVLGALLLVLQHLLRVGAARARARNRAHRCVTVVHCEQRLGRCTDDLEVAEVQEVHIRRRVHRAKAAVNGKRVEPVQLGCPALRRNNLEGISCVHVLDDPSDHRLELLTLHVGGELRWLASDRPFGSRQRSVEQCLDAPDELRDSRVRAVDVVGGCVREDRDRVLEVVEHHQHVGDHEREIRQPEHVLVRLAERGLDRADEVVGEEADGSSSERRGILERCLADVCGLPGDLVRVPLVAQRPAHNVVWRDADERVAAYVLPLRGTLEQEGRPLEPGAQLEECRDGRLAVIDELRAQRYYVVVTGERFGVVERRLNRSASHAGLSVLMRRRPKSAHAHGSSRAGGTAGRRTRCRRDRLSPHARRE